MEPFKLTLQQITFQQDQLDSAPEIDSFNTVVNYDSSFSSNSLPTASIPSTTTNTSSVAISTTHKERWGNTYLTPANPPVQYNCDPIWTDESQLYLINPDDSFLTLSDRQNGKVPTTSAQDIAFLAQVSANTSAVSRHIHKKTRRFVGRTTVISSTSTAVATMPSERASPSQDRDAKTPPELDDNSSFETVAEALRLQWSVIGNKDITPASPDVVAQIVAEAEKKLKATNGSGATPPTSPGSVVHVGDDTAREITPVDSVLTGQSANENQSRTSSPSDKGVDPLQSTTLKTSTEAAVVRTTPDGREVPRSPVSTESMELIRIPAGSLTRTTTKEKGGWFGGADVQGGRPGLKAEERKGEKSSKECADESPVNGSGGQRAEDSQSVSSLSSEQELEKYVQSETDTFLKALPPVRSVDMSQFVQQKHTSPWKEKSFKPVNNTNVSQTQISSSDSGVDMEPSSVLRQPSTSTPTQNAIKTALPQLGPLFPKTEPVVYNMSPRNLFRPVATTGDANPAMRKRLEEVMREKAKLEGQLEVLSQESQSTLQERAELQAQLASLRLKVLSKKGDRAPEREGLKREVEMLKKSRETVEQSMRETQKLLEEKIEESKLSHEELQMTQEAHDKMQLRMKDLRDNLMSKDVAIQALKNKVAELYVEVQNGLQGNVEFQNEMRSTKSDVLSLVKTKEWYQQQLQLAHDVRSQLQKELTILQGHGVSQGTIVERLKNDNARLRLQLSDAQQRALKQKEMLAKHLETIEADMMEREAAFQEIQRERAMIEHSFNSQITCAEDERSRLTMLMQINNDLETRLDKAHEDLKKKRAQIFTMENEQMDVMKKLALSQESLMESDKELEEVSHKLIEVEAQLKVFQAALSGKEREILKLNEEKASAEILLQAVKEEKMVVDSVLVKLQQDMYKVEKSFKMMKSDLNAKVFELEKVNADKARIQREMETMRKDLGIKNRSYDTLHKDYDGKSTRVQQLQIEKTSLESEIKMLMEQFSSEQSLQNVGALDRQALAAELGETKLRLESAEQQLAVKVESDAVQQSSSMRVPDEKYQQVCDENQTLQDRLNETEQRRLEESRRHKQHDEKLDGDLVSLKQELTSRQTAFEDNVDALSSRLREVIADKERVETELEMTQRKFELSSVEQQDHMKTEMQTLASELATARLAQQELHSQLVGLQHAKDAETTSLRQHLSALEDALQRARDEEAGRETSEELNQELSLELEKERGRLAGLAQNNAALKQHVGDLEEALARRESSLVEVHAQLTEAMSGQEHSQQDYMRRIQGLEDVLQKEKDSQRELRKQIGSKISENKRLKKQCDAVKQDGDQLRQDMETRDATMNQLQADLDSNRSSVMGFQGQVTSLTSENKLQEQELERVKRELSDNIARSPVLLEQIQSLQWQLQQKSLEVEHVQEQLRLAEHRQHAEIEGLKKSLQEKQDEIDALKEDVSSTRKEKLSQKTRVSELRSALKSSVQHHKLAKKIQSKKKELAGVDGLVTSQGEDKGTQVNFDLMLTLPPPSFDLEAVEQLLQDTSVKALDSKPLDNLQTCLSSLRSEISGLQKQMDVHTTTVHTSNQSWRSLETEVNELRQVVKTVASTTLAAAVATTSSATDAVHVTSDIVDI